MVVGDSGGFPEVYMTRRHLYGRIKELQCGFSRECNVVSPSGKAQDFDSCTRWFKSNYHSCRVLVAEFSAKSGAYLSETVARKEP